MAKKNKERIIETHHHWHIDWTIKELFRANGCWSGT